MRKAILSVSLTVAVFAFVLQLPINNLTKNVQGQVFQNMAALNIFSLKGNTAVLTAIANSAERWKLDPKMLYAICMIESGCGRNTLSKTSSAKGIYQYINSTWNNSCRKTYRVRVNTSASCDVNNAQMSAEVFAFDRKRREGIVNGIAQASGLPVGVVHYIDHFSPGMAKKLPNKSLYNRSFASVMGNAAASANRMQGKTFGQVVAFFQNKYARYAGTAPANLADLDTTQDETPTTKSLASKWWKSVSGKKVASSQSQQAAQKTTQQQAQQQSTTQGSTSWLDELLGKNTGTSALSTVTPKADLTCSELSSSKMRLGWECPTGTTVSAGFGTKGAIFDTHGAGVGVVSSDLVPGSEYILHCLKGHVLHAEARCAAPSVQTVENVDTSSYDRSEDRVDVIPNGVTMGVRYTGDILFWETTGTQTCRMSVGDRSASGGSEGGVRVGTLTSSILVILQCDTQYGEAVKYQPIVVEL